MRLFVAVRPPESVLELLLGIDRPDVAGLRWTTEPQWHVTLRFLGEVDEPLAVADALRAVPGRLHATAEPEVRATLGPTTAWFPGRHVLQVPVAGLDGLAREVGSVTATWGEPPDHRFSAHLTLARARRGSPGPAGLAGASMAATWRVRAFELVSSVLGRTGSHYETLTTIALDGAAAPPS